jgi:hypothetical protein
MEALKEEVDYSKKDSFSEVGFEYPFTEYTYHFEDKLPYILDYVLI